MSYKLKMRAALRRFGQAQSPAQLQNKLSQVGTSAERQKPDAEIGKFQQFNAESGQYVFSTSTSSVGISPDQVLSNGRLGVGQSVLLSQGTADYTPA